MTERLIPVYLTGTVRRNDAPPECRDGADYLIRTEPWPRSIRLRPATEQIAQALERATAGDLVVIGGHPRRSERPGCDFVEVFSVELLEVFVERQRAA